MAHHIEGPVSQTAWSPEFLAQVLELLIVHRGVDGLRVARPIHAASLQLGWRPGVRAESLLTEALARYGLEGRVLHSTSWRHDGEHVVLTYLAVVETPVALNPNLASEAVARAEVARGEATAPPGSIAVAQVLEHALRHLAWLVAEDQAVGEALPGWRELLAGYIPEPFRQL